MEPITPEYSTFESVIPVRPDDIDMNQHVHNSKYLDYVLAARFDQMQRCYKMPMSDFIDRGYSWFVKIAHIEHKRQLLLSDHAVVKTRVDKIGGKACNVTFQINKQETGKLVAEGWFEYALVSLETGRATQIPEDIVAAYSI